MDTLEQKEQTLQREVDAAALVLAACEEKVNRLSKAVAEAKQEVLDAKAKHQAARSKLFAVQKQNTLAKKCLQVSDHAVVRYLERKLNLDMNVIRKEILSEDLIASVEKLGDGTYGGRVVRDKCVVTVL
jgi:chromosome segregation ATPase